MATLLIGYDLDKPGQNYQRLYDEIKLIDPTYWHCLDSTWLVNTSLAPLEVTNRLLKHMDGNDKLLVTRVRQNETAYGGAMPDQCVNWLETRMQN
jgi:hypothetical protein